MALSDDQKALLRLLAQREQGYEDIGALMGLSVDEVRVKVREALAGLESEAAAPPPSVEESATMPPPPASESSILYGPPRPRPKPRPQRSTRSVEPSHPGESGRSPQNRRRLFELIGGAVVVVLLVLFATGLVDIGGDGDSEPSQARSGTSPTGLAAGEGAKLTQAVLRPVDGGDAIGRALFGRVGDDVVLQVVAQGLEPSPPGKSYTVWLYRSPKLVLRVGASKVSESDGGLAARFPIPAELLAYIASGAFTQIDISLTSDAAYKTELARAKSEERLPAYSGKDVLRGDITGPVAKR